MTRIIAIASQKGGVGKTTTAVNLAAFLQHAGRRTLLIDVDPQGNATSGIGSKRAEDQIFRKLVSGALSWKRCITQSNLENLFILPSFAQPEDAACVEDVDAARVAELHDSLLDMSPTFDHVVIDCPPSFGPLPLFALQLADSVLIPVQSEYFAMEGLSQILPLIERIDRSRTRGLDIEGLLLTMLGSMATGLPA